jgi:hypothetical protein
MAYNIIKPIGGNNMYGEKRRREDNTKSEIVREKGWYIPTLHEKYLKEPKHL